MNDTVPFPPEACLSGVWVTALGYDKVPVDNASNWMKSLHYRTTFDRPVESEHTYLHFGAVDWYAEVWLNGVNLGNHTGGYSSFSLDATNALKSVGNELVVYTYVHQLGEERRGTAQEVVSRIHYSPLPPLPTT